MKKKIAGLVIAIIVVLAGIWFIAPRIHEKSGGQKTTTGEVTPAQDLQELMKKKGEAVLQESYNRPLITVYQNLLKQYPDSLDLKKKLEEARRAAGEEDPKQKPSP